MFMSTTERAWEIKGGGTYHRTAAGQRLTASGVVNPSDAVRKRIISTEDRGTRPYL